MESLFLNIFRYFQKRRATFWILFVLLIMVLSWGASRVRLEQDITRFFPDDHRVENLQEIFQHSPFAERLVIMVSMKDSTVATDPDLLVSVAGVLSERIGQELSPFIKDFRSQVDEGVVMDMFPSVYEHLPVFLEESDYGYLDSIRQPAVAAKILEHHYRQLLSPSGVALKNILVQDPLGFSFVVLKKLQHLQYDENFELYDGYIMTRDHRHVLLFIQPAFAPNDTKNNQPFIEALQRLMLETSSANESIIASCFGGAVVAVDNARQLQRDIVLTVSAMLILLLVILLRYFRRKRVPFIILVPVAFGALFALCCVAIIQGSLSILALAVGAIILGVAVDYSLHFLVHLKHTQSLEQVISDLVKPLTLGSLTTVAAFFCLRFTNAIVLQDIGLFAGFSLIGAALCSLLILPHLVSPHVIDRREGLLDRWTGVRRKESRYLVYGIVLITPFFLYKAGSVRFNNDVSTLNFMTAETRKAQERLETLTKASLNSVYVLASGRTLEEALQKNEQTLPRLRDLKERGVAQKISSVSSFLVSDSLQQLRIKRWNAFWSTGQKEALRDVVHREGAKLKFSTKVLQNFDERLSRPYTILPAGTRQAMQDAFYRDYVLQNAHKVTVITLAQVAPWQKDDLYQALKETPSQATDRQQLANLFVEYVHADFNFIVTFTGVLVFLVLLISYGRIEITLITFLPMFFTWIWILGIMAWMGIEFNIVNVMVSTFIFGLGDDYSIFIMDGLQQEYRAGKKNLASVRTSVLLSAFTTVAGLGVLIFAKHPALKSIAAIAIIGIICVFIMAQTVEPFFFRVLITNRTRRGLAPMTFLGICKTFLTYSFFVVGSVLLTIVGLLLKAIPFGRKRLQYFFHLLIKSFTWTLVYLAVNLKKKIINRTQQTFSRSSIVICNHSSFLDILLTTMLHPKLILLTNKWVWNSPVFGGVVRLAGYHPVMEGAEDSVHRLRSKVEEGYSLVVFPEGTRSPDGKLKRFHKGAFYMAEAMQLPIQPLVIHGAAMGITKGDIYLNDSTITLKFLPCIEPDDKRFGQTYSERTKNISRYFRQEYELLARVSETPEYFAYLLTTNYVYKGPVLEWYLRVKLRLENYYKPFHDLIPRKASVLDLGCGYGFLCYMLQFLSEERVITGVDYDEHKIETAQHGYLRSERLQFHCADVTRFPLGKYDVIIISDVLHYLTPAAQESLMVRCFAALRPGGRLIVRDGNADLKERHKGTKLTEFFSVKVLKFNKSVTEMNFLSGETVKRLAENHGLTVTVRDDTKYTSNVIFVISKQEEVHAAI